MKRSNKRKAFTLVEIMIVVLIIGILLAIAVPNFMQARASSRQQAIVASLEKVDAAIAQCAMDDNLAAGDTCANLARYMNPIPPRFPVTGPFVAGTVMDDQGNGASTFRGQNAAWWRQNRTGL